MGLFKFLKKSPSRELWAVISFNLSARLEALRREYFEQCVKVIQEYSKEKDEPEMKIVNRELGGKADLAIKAYQLYLTSLFLAHHGYIPKSQGKDFADILYAQVCGTQLVDCLSYFSRYHGAKGGDQLRYFSNDVASYITGNDRPLWEGLLIGPSVIPFTQLVHLTVAEAFGDNKTAEKVSRELTEKMVEVEKLTKKLDENTNET